VIKALFDLQDRYKVNLISMLSWSFEFEGKEYFEGFRTLATNGVDKPVLNVFRMAGLMSGNRVGTSSTGSFRWTRSSRRVCARRRTSTSKASGDYDVEWTD
jgi:hypothetical protein